MQPTSTSRDDQAPPRFVELTTTQGDKVAGAARRVDALALGRGMVIVAGDRAGQVVQRVRARGGSDAPWLVDVQLVGGETIAVPTSHAFAVLEDRPIERLGRIELRTAAGVIARLCQPGMASGWRDRRDEEARTSTRAGFAGYPYVDDGYELMGGLPREWQILPEVGDWPYNMVWAHPGDRALLRYCEGDLAVEIADDAEAFRALVARERKENPAP